MRPEEILGLLPHLYYGSDHSPGFLLFFYELLFWIIAVLLTFGLIRLGPGYLRELNSGLATSAVMPVCGCWYSPSQLVCCGSLCYH